jgi:hypothetical protein
MKKLLMIALVLAALPLFGQETAPTINMSGTVEFDFFNRTQNDTDKGGTKLIDSEINQGYWGTVSGAFAANMLLADDINAFIKVKLNESKSAGVDNKPATVFEEMWAGKKDAFGVAGLGFKAGKQDVPFNMNIDNGVTHTFTYGTALMTSGIGQINNAWGFGVSYKAEGVGLFTLTTFEGLGGFSTPDKADEDTGLFNSMALQWDTAKDAFGMKGLRIVVGYEMRASLADMDNGSGISAGASYEVVPGLVVGLEIDQSSFMTPAIDYDPGPGFKYTAMDAKGGMLMALNADYKVNDMFRIGLSYESLAYSKNDDLGLKASTDTRLGLHGAYILGKASEIQFEYCSLANSLKDINNADLDADGDKDKPGYSQIAIGYKGKI